MDDCDIDRGKFVEHDGQELAVFRLSDGSVHVVDNSCPHASGNLSGGEIENGIVACPWHFWKFDLTTGMCVDSPQARVKKYPSDIQDGWVVVNLSENGR